MPAAPTASAAKDNLRKEIFEHRGTVLLCSVLSHAWQRSHSKNRPLVFLCSESGTPDGVSLFVSAYLECCLIAPER